MRLHINYSVGKRFKLHLLLVHAACFNIHLMICVRVYKCTCVCVRVRIAST